MYIYIYIHTAFSNKQPFLSSSMFGRNIASRGRVAFQHPEACVEAVCSSVALPRRNFCIVVVCLFRVIVKQTTCCVVRFVVNSVSGCGISSL